MVLGEINPGTMARHNVTANTQRFRDGASLTS